MQRGMGRGQGGLGRGRGQRMRMQGRRWMMSSAGNQNVTRSAFHPDNYYLRYPEADQAAPQSAETQVANATTPDRAETKEDTQRSDRVAAVNTRRCILCGICQAICPVEAISIGRTVMINQDLCTGCGQCVAVCPRQALFLKKP